MMKIINSIKAFFLKRAKEKRLKDVKQYQAFINKMAEVDSQTIFEQEIPMWNGKMVDLKDMDEYLEWKKKQL